MTKLKQIVKEKLNPISNKIDEISQNLNKNKKEIINLCKWFLKPMDDEFLNPIPRIIILILSVIIFIVILRIDPITRIIIIILMVMFYYIIKTFLD